MYWDCVDRIPTKGPNLDTNQTQVSLGGTDTFG